MHLYGYNRITDLNLGTAAVPSPNNLGRDPAEAEEGAGDVEGDGEVSRRAGQADLQQTLLVLEEARQGLLTSMVRPGTLSLAIRGSDVQCCRAVPF